MLVLSEGVAILRDFIEEDIEDYVRWDTVETEWKLWDAPWEHVGQTDAQRAAALADDVAWMREHAREVALLRGDAPRRRFEVCVLDGGEEGSHQGREATIRSLGQPDAIHLRLTGGGFPRRCTSAAFRLIASMAISPSRKTVRISPRASTSTAWRRVVAGMRSALFGCLQNICSGRGRRNFTVKRGPATSA